VSPLFSDLVLNVVGWTISFVFCGLLVFVQSVDVMVRGSILVSVRW
jgi:hypothetical protein